MRIGYGVQFRNNRIKGNDSLRLSTLNCDRIFMDEATGGRTSGDSLRRALEFLRKGDILVVVNFDRLGRGLDEIVDVIAGLWNRGISIAIDEAGIAAGSPRADEFGAICAVLSESSKALRSGVSIWGGRPNPQPRRGRPLVFGEEDQAKARRMLADGRYTVLEVARQLNVSPATIYRYCPRTPRE